MERFQVSDSLSTESFGVLPSRATVVRELANVLTNIRRLFCVAFLAFALRPFGTIAIGIALMLYALYAYPSNTQRCGLDQADNSA